MAYPISKLWYYPLCKVFIKRIKGIGNIPLKTPFIVVANHETLIDPLLIFFPILKKLNKKMHFLATPTWWFLGETVCREWAGCVPLFDSKHAYTEMKELLKKRNIVGIFSEGHLSKKIKNPKTGALRLAIETKVPILPIGIKSSYLPFNSTINIGKLIYFKSKKNMDKQMSNLMRNVYNLRNHKIKAS